MKYKRKPLMIEAIQWLGSNKDEVFKFIGNNLQIEKNYTILKKDEDYFILIKTDGCYYGIDIGDYIIKEDSGTISGCKQSVFEDTYEIC